MRCLIIVVFLICFLTSCATVPFERTSLVLLGDVDPASVREEFADLLASSFEAVSSISFYYKYQSFAGIGYVTVDARSKTFAVACLSPAGIKIFEVKGEENSAREVFFTEQFKKYGDGAQAVAADIRKIYFDRIPEVHAEVQKKKRRVIFTQPFAKGKIEYIFAGPDKYLVEKRYKEKGRRIWTVYYADYLEKNGKVYPRKILLKQHKYGYSMMVHTKEISV